MIINKKVIRTIMVNKSQYFGSLALIIISCLLFTMFNQLKSNMSKATSSFEKSYNLEDANFITQTKLKDIKKLESKFNALLEESKSVDYEVSNDKTLRILTYNEKVNIPAVISGKAPDGGKILIDPAYAKANKLKVGDNIIIYNKTFKISGFIAIPNYIYPLKSENDLLSDPNSFGVAVIGKSHFDEIGIGNRMYSIRFKGDRSNLNSRISNFEDYLKAQNIIVLKWVNASENPRITYVNMKLEGINKMSSSMPIAILVLTCILTAVVMWRMLKKEFIIIGTLYAIGYKKREIMNHYMRYPLIIAIIGGVIGTILGIFTLKTMLKLMLTYFNIPLTSIQIDLKYILISIILPSIFLGISGYVIVNKALKYSPLELMRGGREKSKVNFIEKRLKLDRFNFSTKFKVREQLRSIGRSIFLLFGIIFATMLLLLGFAEKSSFDFLINKSYGATFKYKYYYVFNSIQINEPTSGEPFLELPFIAKSNENINLTVYGISPNSQYVSLKDKLGQKLDYRKVVITRPLAERLKVNKGDKIYLISKLNSKSYNIKVDDIAETYSGEYIFMPISKLNDIVKYPSYSYIGLWSENKINISKDRLLSSGTADDLKSAFNAITQPLQYSIAVISFVSFIIGLIVIYVVTSLIIEENTKNISLMKVLGYRKKEIYSLILNSSFFIIVLGYILGVPMLLISLNAMFKSLTKSMNFTFPVIINYVYIILGFIIICFTYQISKALNKKKINKINMYEALKSGVE